jgi:hypothetical protein
MLEDGGSSWGGKGEDGGSLWGGKDEENEGKMACDGHATR